MTEPSEAPRGQAYVLPSGRVVRLAMPDLWAVISAVGRVPNPVLTAVLDLLVQDGSYTPQAATADLYLRKREEVLGIYACAALCLVEPRLALGRPPGEGEIGPRELPYLDAEVIYARFFRLGDTSFFGAVPAAPDPARPAGAAPDRDDLPPAAEPLPGGR